MIEKNSLEFALWKDAYNFRNSLTPAPRYSDSDAFWKKVMDTANGYNNKYKDTALKILAEHLFLGGVLQLEYESKQAEQTRDLIKELADKLSINKQIS